MAGRDQSQRLARRRRGVVTISLRFEDGCVSYRIVRTGIGTGTVYRPVLASTVVAHRVRRLVDAIMAEAQPATGGDALWEQLPLFTESDGPTNG